jgi:hypothetical protein
MSRPLPIGVPKVALAGICHDHAVGRDRHPGIELGGIDM